MTPNMLGWIGTAIMAAGSVDIAHKRVRGLWLMFAGNIFWGATGLWSDLPSLVGVSVFMGALDLYGVYRWSK